MSIQELGAAPIKWGCLNMVPQGTSIYREIANSKENPFIIHDNSGNVYVVSGHNRHHDESPVYHGWDIKLDREVGVKTYDTDPNTSKEEAHSIATLAHPNIVEAYNYIQKVEVNGKVVDALITEWIHGPSLSTLLEAYKEKGIGPIVSDLKKLVISISDAISYMQSPGYILTPPETELFGNYRRRTSLQYPILHRDIKPDNIMLDIRHGIFKILDLGINSGIAGNERHGTPAYVSPERINNAIETESSEVFSWAITLYIFMTGHHPFGDEILEETTKPYVKYLRIRDKYPNLSDLYRVFGSNLELADYMASVFTKGFIKDPALRFQTARQFGAYLYRGLSKMDDSQQLIYDNPIQQARQDTNIVF